MGTTFTCVATGDWNDDATWGLSNGDYPGNGGATDDEVIIDVANKSGGAGALTVTLVADVELKAIKMAGGASGFATLHTASEHTLTLNDTAFSGYSAHITGQTGFTGNVNFTFTKNGTTHIIIDPAYHTNKLNDITCNHSSLALHLLSAINIKGDLNCTAGSFSTQSSGGGTSHALTVDGKTEISSGTLTLNDSTCLFNSAGTAGGLILNANATVTAGASSTVTMGSIEASYNSSITVTLAGTNTINHYRSSSDKIMKLPPGVVDPESSTTSFTITTTATNCEVSAVNLVNLTFTPAGAANATYNLDSGYGGIDIEGNLILNDGATVNANNQNCKAEGDVTINDGATLLGTASVCEFGSLTIANGAEYSATSGTTTITSRTGGTGTYALENNGTFTHNKGTVKITDSDNVVSLGLDSSLYNLELSGGSKKIRNNTTINNNLTLTSGDLYGHSGSLTLDVKGQTILNGGTTGQNIAFTGTMNWGSVTVNSGTLKLSSGTNNAESFRNVGGAIQ